MHVGVLYVHVRPRDSLLVQQEVQSDGTYVFSIRGTDAASQEMERYTFFIPAEQWPAFLEQLRQICRPS